VGGIMDAERRLQALEQYMELSTVSKAANK